MTPWRKAVLTSPIITHLSLILERIRKKEQRLLRKSPASKSSGLPPMTVSHATRLHLACVISWVPVFARTHFVVTNILSCFLEPLRLVHLVVTNISRATKSKARSSKDISSIDAEVRGEQYERQIVHKLRGKTPCTDENNTTTRCANNVFLC